ncbi:MAG TPA: phosphoglycerol geranylgeranyltransferase, partial [Candidatus Eisenbacteria bacterium]|nr:phosphoglycerol geranylgeranyltransferase [Candidatus Eisenbacteria bacterium]
MPLEHPIFDALLAAAKRQGCGHLVLVDPDRVLPERAEAIARECAAAGADAILFGSSTPFARDPAPVLRALRARYDGPIVLFPGSAAQVRLDIDAVLFLSLLSGRDARFLVEEQVAAAPRLLAAGIETIATAYLLVGEDEGGSVARVTGTKPLPVAPGSIVAAHAQAAACLGFSLVYLEAGSGASAPVPASIVRDVAASAPVPLVVGGGIRRPEQAAALAAAGARFIVTGTAHEDGAGVTPFTDAIHQPAAAL